MAQRTYSTALRWRVLRATLLTLVPLLSLALRPAWGQVPAGDMGVPADFDAVGPGDPYSGGFFANSMNTYFHLEHQEWEGFGDVPAFTALGATRFLLDDSGSLLLTGEGRITNEGGGGVSAGIQRRVLLDGVVVGGGVYYDLSQTENDNFYQQAGASLEIFHGLWGARLNSYVPFGKQGAFIGIGEPVFTGGDVVFEGNNIVAPATQTRTDESAFGGLDVEIKRSIYSLSNEIYVGGYHLDDNHGNEADGWKVGARGWIMPSVMANISIAEDDVFGTNVYGGFTWYFGRNAPLVGPITMCDMLTIPVERERQVAVAELQTALDTNIVLTLDDEPITVLHVDDDGAGMGDGTFEDPYGSLTDADTDPDKADYDIVLVHPDTVFDDQTYTLADGQRLLGEGDNNQHVVDTDQGGLIFLPDAVDGSAARPQINNVTGTAITLADESEVSNFSINDSDTALLASGLTTGDVNVNRTEITGGGRGVDIDGSDGQFTLTEVSITDVTDIALRINGGTADVDFGSDTIDQTIQLYGGSSIMQGDDATALAVTGGHTGALNMAAASSIAATDGDGLQFNDADGTYDLAGAISLNGGDAGVDVLNDTNGEITFADLTITDPTGVAFLVDGGDGDINYNGGGINKSTAGSIVDIQNRAGGTIDINVSVASEGVAGGINIAGAAADNTVRFDGPVEIGNTANRVTGGIGVNIDNNGQTGAEVLFANLDVFTNGVQGLVATGDGLLTVDDGQVDVLNQQAVNLDDLKADVSLSGVLVTNSIGPAIDLNALAADSNFTVSDGNAGTVDDVVVNGSSGVGIEATNNLGQLVFSSVDIDNTVGAGIRLMDNDTDTLTIGGGTIDQTTGDGIESVDSDNLLVNNVSIGQNTAINGDGVSVANTDGTTRTVAVTNNDILANGYALNVNNTGAGDLQANLSGNTLESVNMAGANIDGSAGTGTLYVTGFNGVTVEGNATGNGGVVLNEVTFDALPGGAINPVNAGVLTVGGSADPVEGIGVDIQDVSGELSVATANIFSNNGIALNVNVPGSSFNLAVNGGTVEAAGADAIVLNDVESFSLNNTTVNNGAGFDTVNTTDSGLSGSVNTAANFSSTDGGGNTGSISFNGGADTVP